MSVDCVITAHEPNQKNAQSAHHHYTAVRIIGDHAIKKNSASCVVQQRVEARSVLEQGARGHKEPHAHGFRFKVQHDRAIHDEMPYFSSVAILPKSGTIRYDPIPSHPTYHTIPQRDVQRFFQSPHAAFVVVGAAVRWHSTAVAYNIIHGAISKNTSRNLPTNNQAQHHSTLVRRWTIRFFERLRFHRTTQQPITQKTPTQCHGIQCHGAVLWLRIVRSHAQTRHWMERATYSYDMYADKINKQIGVQISYVDMRKKKKEGPSLCTPCRENDDHFFFITAQPLLRPTGHFLPDSSSRWSFVPACSLKVERMANVEEDQRKNKRVLGKVFVGCTAVHHRFFTFLFFTFNFGGVCVSVHHRFSLFFMSF